MNHSFRGLDGLRGLLALVVVFSHLSLFGSGSIAGGIAVDAFFILSGFVLSYKYVNRTPGISLHDFMVKRFIRLYPLHIFTFLLVSLLIIWSIFNNIKIVDINDYKSQGLFKFFQNIFLMQGLGFTAPLTYNGPSWSVSIEFWLAPFVFYLMHYKYKYRYIPLLYLLCILLGVNYSNHDNHYLNLYGIFNVGLIRGIIGLTLGVYLYDIYSSNFYKNFFKNQYLGLLIFILTFISLFIKNNALFDDFDLIIFIFLLPILILFLSNDNLLLSKVVGKFQFLGRMSYSIYLIQLPIFYIAMIFNLSTFIIIFLIIFSAYFVDIYIDRYFQNLLNIRLLGRNTAL